MIFLLFFDHAILYEKVKISPWLLQNFQGVRVLPAILPLSTKVKYFPLIQMVKMAIELEKEA